MSQHYTRNTISAECYCTKCGRATQHRIDDRRKGPCLECIARLDLPKEPKTATVTQETLFAPPCNEVTKA